MRQLTENEVVGVICVSAIVAFSILMLSVGLFHHYNKKIDQERYHDSIMVILKSKDK